ncbi:MAG TPA: hypothetical protein GX731_06225 [Clostridiales bacterium]|nr:hypothetical protein [Clostridiales bacterium]
MSNIIDISSKLTNERPKLKLAEGKIYEIDDRKNTVIKLDSIMSEKDLNDVTNIDKMAELLLGGQAVKDINEMDLSMSAYQNIMIGLLAGITGDTFEVTEARFRKEAGI